MDLPEVEEYSDNVVLDSRENVVVEYFPKWPDGKKHSRSVYAGTSEECEEKLAELIQQMKMEIAEAKRFAAEGKWEQVMALAGQKKARGARGIESGHQEKTTTV